MLCFVRQLIKLQLDFAAAFIFACLKNNKIASKLEHKSIRAKKNGGAGNRTRSAFASLTIGALPLLRSPEPYGSGSLSPQLRGKILFPHPFWVRFVHGGGAGNRTPVPA